MKRIAWLMSLSTLVLAGCLPEDDKKDNNNGGDGGNVEPKIYGELVDACPDLENRDDLNLDSDNVGFAMMDPLFTTSTVSVAVGNLCDVTSDIATSTYSDVALATFKDNFYLMGRSKQDNLTKFSINSERKAEQQWQFSLLADDESANPYAVAFVSDSKAYVARYGANEVLIIDPSVDIQNGDDFIKGKIDFSAYSDNSNVDSKPGIASVKIVNNQLFVLLQRLSGVPVNVSYIAVVDLDTDLEVETNSDETDGLKGIPLPIMNALEMQVFDTDLYIAGVAYSWGAIDNPNRWAGGVAKVDTTIYEASLVVDDGDVEEHPYGNISQVLVTSETDGYFTGSQSWGNDSVYHFNPSDLEAPITELVGLGGTGIGDLGVVTLEGQVEALLVPKSSAEGSEPELKIFDSFTQEEIASVPTELNVGSLVTFDR